MADQRRHWGRKPQKTAKLNNLNFHPFEIARASSGWKLLIFTEFESKH